MKAGTFVATFIAIGLIAYQHQPSLFNASAPKESVKTLPTEVEIKAHLLTHSQFATTAGVHSSEKLVELQIPVDSLFIANSTALKPEAERQFSQLVKYFDSFDQGSHFEVALLGQPDSGFNPKFRSNRARKLAEVIETAGVQTERIQKVWQVVLDEPAVRELASQAGPIASLDFAKSQYFSVRIRTSN